MKKNKMMISVILSTLFFTAPVDAQNSRNAVKQVKINRIVSMPDMPETGLYTALGDVRQGPLHNGGEFHESLNSLAAILGAGLVGIDKTHQDGYNYVKMVQNFYNCANGWNIVMNNTNPRVADLGGGYGCFSSC